MVLPLCALFASLAIIMFSLMPKRLFGIDFAFLYCVALILATTTFSVFDVNLHIVTVEKNPTISFSNMICRLITIPVMIMMAVDVLQYSKGRKPQWIVAMVIWLVLTVFDWVLNFLHVTTYQKSFIWHAGSTLIMYLGFIVTSWGLTWMYRRLDRSVRQL